MREAIYDFETLGQNFEDAPALSLAFMEFDSERIMSDRPYEYDELLEMCGYIKFDVAEQVKVHRKKIQKETLDWWKQQGDEAKKVLKPSTDDQSISELPKVLQEHFGDFWKIKRTWSRGNTFDPMFLRKIMQDIGSEDPFKWWTIRDTRSFLDALLIGSGMDNKFVLPEWEAKFVAHDARHDIVVDVLRMQSTIRAIHVDDA